MLWQVLKNQVLDWTIKAKIMDSQGEKDYKDCDLCILSNQQL